MAKVEISASRLHKVAERLKVIANEALSTSQRLSQNVILTGVGGESQVERLKGQAEEARVAGSKGERYLRECSRVRVLIGKHNEEHGVNALMAQLDVVNKLIVHKKFLLEQAKQVGAIAPEELLDYKVVVNSESRYGGSSGVSVNVLGASGVSALEEELSALQREAFVLSDKMAELNAKRISVELDDGVAKEVLGV